MLKKRYLAYKRWLDWHQQFKKIWYGMLVLGILSLALLAVAGAILLFTPLVIPLLLFSVGLSIALASILIFPIPPLVRGLTLLLKIFKKPLGKDEKNNLYGARIRVNLALLQIIPLVLGLLTGFLVIYFIMPMILVSTPLTILIPLALTIAFTAAIITYEVTILIEGRVIERRTSGEDRDYLKLAQKKPRYDIAQRNAIRRRTTNTFSLKYQQSSSISSNLSEFSGLRARVDRENQAMLRHAGKHSIYSSHLAQHKLMDGETDVAVCTNMVLGYFPIIKQVI